METSELIAYALAAVSAVWVFITQLVPKVTGAKLERDKKRLEAEIDDRRDRREADQELAKLERAYLDAEAQATQQMLTDLVNRSLDEKGKVDEFIRSEIAEWLKLLACLPALSDDVRAIKYELRNQATQIKIMVSLISEVYDRDRSQKKQDD